MAMDLKRAETHLRRSRIRAEGAAVKISNQFRAQAIVDAYGKRIRGVELLARKWLQFNEIESMLRADIDAVNAASILLRTNAYETVHVNAEPTSMIRSEWMEAMAFGAKEGLVIEVVERNNILMSNLIMSQMTSVVDLVRHCGGLIALDDATLQTRPFSSWRSCARKSSRSSVQSTSDRSRHSVTPRLLLNASKRFSRQTWPEVLVRIVCRATSATSNMNAPCPWRLPLLAWWRAARHKSPICVWKGSPIRVHLMCSCPRQAAMEAPRQ